MRLRSASLIGSAMAVLLAVGWHPTTAWAQEKKGKTVPYPGAVRPTRAPPAGPHLDRFHECQMDIRTCRESGMGRGSFREILNPRCCHGRQL